MFKIASQQLYEFLNGNSVVYNYFNDRIFPLFAPDTTSFPFVTYKIQSGNQETKDSKAVNISLFMWYQENKITTLFEAHDAILALLETNDNIILEQDASFTDVDPDFQKPYAQINFKYFIN